MQFYLQTMYHVISGVLNRMITMSAKHFQCEKENTASLMFKNQSEKFCECAVTVQLPDSRSPTATGLILLNKQGLKGANLNMRICNCVNRFACDHQEVNVLTAAASNCSDVRPVKENFHGSYSKKCDAVIVSNKRQREPELLRRFKLTITHENWEAMADMGVSELTRNNSSQTEDSGFECSAVDDSALRTTDFCVYKKSKLNNQAKFDLFNSLPNETVLKIFHWLPKTSLVKCAQVCKRFQRLAMDCSLWHRVDANMKDLHSGMLGCILLRGCQYLRLARSTISCPVFSPRPSSLSLPLLYLDLSMASIAADDLAEVLSGCSSLKKLSLESLQLNDAVLEHIARNTNLDALNLTTCTNVNPVLLIKVVESCTKLSALNISWIPGLKSHDFMALFCVLPRKLISLNVAGGRNHFNDDHLAMICQRALLLKELDISDCIAVNGPGLEYLAHLRSLAVLSISRCYGIANSQSLYVLRHVSSLSHLQIFGMPEEELIMHDLRKYGGLKRVEFNTMPFSGVARPTTGVRRTSIWHARVRD